MKKKKCSRCKEMKTIDNFYKNNRTKSGLGGSCRDCYRTPVKGFIYLITNPSWVGFVKIGRANNPIKRLNSYQTCSPLRDYEMNYNVFVNDLHIVENYFKEKYSNEFGEWYKIPINKAIEQIEKIIKLNKLK